MGWARYPVIRSLGRRINVWKSALENAYLMRVPGVIHVGANVGQERDLYRQLGLRVLWIEPIDEVFNTLVSNIEGYQEQRAVKALVAEVDGQQVTLNVANNNGASSSTLDLALHKELWPEVAYTRRETHSTVTLATLCSTHSIDPGDYQALVMDTQGTELGVLRGAEPCLSAFRYIKSEVADFEAYQGCATLEQMDKYLRSQDFAKHSIRRFAHRPGVGNYFDVVWKRTGSHRRRPWR